MNRFNLAAIRTANAFTKLSLMAVAIVTLLGIGAPVRAQSGTVTFTLTSATPDSDVVSVTTDGGKTYTKVYSGRYSGSYNGGASNFNVFCTDISHDISVGGSYKANVQNLVTDTAGKLNGSYYAGGLSSALTSGDYGSVYPEGSPSASQRASEVAWLTDNYLMATDKAFSSGASGSTVLTDNMAAIQLSIWDIAQDGGDGVKAGNFVLADSYQATLSGLVSYYEKVASGYSNFQSKDAAWIQAPLAADGTHLQDFVTLSPAPVPEASVFVTTASLIGMTGFGLLRGRRRQQGANAQTSVA